MPQETITSSNKRIAKNTVFLYCRMILLLVVTLYTSRLVLAELGKVNFGIYNVVASIVVMFSFINSSMSTSTQRFLTFELGKGNLTRLRRTFAASLNIHILIGLLIVVLAETIGLWFVNYRLVIPADRLFDANIVYQCSILSFFITITQVPYNASLIAHEKMDVFAYLSILEGIGKFVIAYSLLWVSHDKLIVYAVLILVFQALLMMLYRAYCFKHYEECRFTLFWDRQLYKSLTSFAGWNMFGSIAWLFRAQGLTILLNLFFGPVLNAAKGLADSVASSVTGFVNNFTTAMNPQITKDYAAGQVQQMEKLCFSGTKFSFLMLFFIALPTIINIDYILQLWLVDVPEYTAQFVILTLVAGLADALLGSSQFITALMATGRIRNYQIIVSIVIMTVLPVSYVLLYWGGGPLTMMYVMIAVNVVADLVRFLFCRQQIGFSLRRLATAVWLPSLLMMALVLPANLLVKDYLLPDDTLPAFVLRCLWAVLTVVACSWVLVLTVDERNILLQAVSKKFKQLRHG